MPFQDHLKVASSEMMKAASLMRQEISDLRSEEANLQKLVNQNIVQITAQIQARQKEMSNNADSSSNAQNQTVVNALMRQIADAKSQMGKDQQRIRDLIREKESLAGSIEQQAKVVQP